MKLRLTQKDLLFGIYRGPKDSLNEGLNVWWNGRFIWPRKRVPAKRNTEEQNILFDSELQEK